MTSFYGPYLPLSLRIPVAPTLYIAVGHPQLVGQVMGFIDHEARKARPLQ